MGNRETAGTATEGHMVTTAADVRQMLTPEENEALTTALSLTDKTRPPAPSAAEWIYTAFRWRSTYQGYGYWVRIYLRLRAVESKCSRLRQRYDDYRN